MKPGRITQISGWRKPSAPDVVLRGRRLRQKASWQRQILAAAAAKLASRPVRIMLSREGVFRIVGGRTVTEQRVALGARPMGGSTP